MQPGLRLTLQRVAAPSSSCASEKVQNQGVCWKSKVSEKCQLFSCLPPDTASSTNPLGLPASGPGLTHPAVKLPQVEIREQMKAGRRQDREPNVNSSIERETSHVVESEANTQETMETSSRLWIHRWAGPREISHQEWQQKGHPKSTEDATSQSNLQSS